MSTRIWFRRIWIRRWGVAFLPLQITWRDQWTGSHGLEIGWGERSLLQLGFKRDAA